MAIALDTFEHGESDATTTTVNMTVAAGSNKALVVLISGEGTPGGESDSATWNTSESLTYIAGSYADNGDAQFVEAWYLVNPTSTTANLVVDYKDATSPPASVSIWSLTNVSQTDPIGAVDEYGETSGDSPKVNSITTETDASWVLQVLGLGGTSTPRISPDDGQTERLDIAVEGSFDTWSGDLLVATAGAQQMDLTDDIDNGDWSQQLIIEVKLAGGGPTGVKTINDTAIASVKTMNDTIIASVKTING